MGGYFGLKEMVLMWWRRKKKKQLQQGTETWSSSL
jgi:hypothetical protein